MITLDILKKFNRQMESPVIKKRKIRSDITVMYDRTEIHHLYVTDNKDEYRHLLECYNITERELKKILYDIKNPPNDENEA